MEYGWIASSDDDVAAILAHPDMHTRPADERIPVTLAGTALGEVYARLVRMNDGERHTALRRIAETRLAAWDLAAIERLAEVAARHHEPRDIAPFVLATVIGIDDPANAVPLIWDFARAVGGSATEDEQRRGIPAAERLLQMLPDGDDPDLRANLLGFLFQSATTVAASIENRIGPAMRPPVPFTRRWAATDVELCGRTIHRGELVVVLLSSPRFAFGGGRHQCPDQRVAEAITNGAVRALMSDEARSDERAPSRQPA